MIQLELDDVVSGYTGTDVLRGVSLTVTPGTCLAVLGPNGAGKSTLLKTISGQLKIRGGSSRLDGRDITSWRPHKVARAGVRWLGDPRPVYTSLTVEDNLIVGGTIIGKRAAAERIEWVHDLMPILREKRHEAAGALSGGQQQMLAIAQALMSKPRFLCLDEPSLGLAPTVINSLSTLIGELTTAGMGIIWAEQYPEVALKRATDVVVIGAGKIALAGKSEDISREQLEDVYLGVAH